MGNGSEVVVTDIGSDIGNRYRTYVTDIGSTRMHYIGNLWSNLRNDEQQNIPKK